MKRDKDGDCGECGSEYVGPDDYDYDCTGPYFCHTCGAEVKD